MVNLNGSLNHTDFRIPHFGLFIIGYIKSCSQFKKKGGWKIGMEKCYVQTRGLDPDPVIFRHVY